MNLCTGYKYEINGLTEENKQIIKEDIIKTIKNIFSSEEEFNHIMKVISSFLIQTNKEEKAYFWLGDGRNGKGTISTLLRNVLNNYWGELNTEYYTTYKHRADEPNQNLYNCRNARILNSSEVPNQNEKGEKIKFINDAFCRLTGNDIIQARELGTKNVAVFKAGKVLIQLNDMPSFTGNINKKDVSLKERIEIHKLPYSFTDNEELLRSNPEKYKAIDRSIKVKFSTDEYRHVMLNLMLEYFKLY